MIVEITQLDENLGSLTGENASRDLLSRIALYLRAYPKVEVWYDGRRLDPRAIEDHSESVAVSGLHDGETLDGELTVIEWKIPIDRALYLCDDGGFAKGELAPGIKAKGFNFTAYLKVPMFGMMTDADLAILELNPRVNAVLQATKSQLRAYFRRREAQLAKGVITKWKAEGVYPYRGEATSQIEQVEREVFDVCALTVHEYLPSFDESKREQKKLTLSLIRQALESSPGSLQTILREVLALPKDQQDDLAQLLQTTRLGAIINAAKMVSERLTFIVSLEQMLFDNGLKQRLLERTQLHRILVNELWIFGEQFTLGIDDESLKALLTKHIQVLQREELSPEVQVKDLSGRDAIVDLMLYRRRPLGEPERYEHLVIELKRPSVILGQKEIGQIEKYAFSVAKDERFDKQHTHWTFVLIGNDLDDFARERCGERTKEFGHIYATDSLDIYVKRWSTVIEQAKWRYEFLRNKLEYEAKSSDATAYLRNKYAAYLPEVS